MTRLLVSTAIGLALGLLAPITRAPNIFVYASAYAAQPEIPDWIERSCCGPSDMRRLSASQVKQREDGSWLAEGYNRPISPSKVQPSQDSNYYIFYASPDQMQPYCFFAPEAF